VSVLTAAVAAGVVVFTLVAALLRADEPRLLARAVRQRLGRG